MTNRDCKMRLLLILILFCAICTNAEAQELNAKVTVNHSQIQGTDASVFDNLQ